MNLSPRTASAALLLAGLALPACSDNAATKHSTTSSSGSGAGGGGGGDAVTGPLGDQLAVDDKLAIDGLTGPVDVVRDKYGRPHIYATNINDAMKVEGYLIAQDRGLELEFLRRVSEGRIAEILASADASLIDVDISYRHIGLARTAQKQYDALAKDDPLRLALDAYSDGVTQYYKKLRSNEAKLPDGVFGIDLSAFTDWTGVDSLAIGRLQTYLLSYDGDVDLQNQELFDAARSVFSAGDADPAVAKRAGIEQELVRFAPADAATTTTGYPAGAKAKKPTPKGPGTPASPKARDLSPLRGYLKALQTSRSIFTREGFGSNNWSIAPSRSATGNALVASDPHLSLSAPSIFWPVSIDVTAPKGGDDSQNLKVGGVAFPGIPGIILGHNEHIAWGATVAGYDVSDAYAETLTADAKSVVFNGQPVAIQTVDEKIIIQGRDPITYTVQIVPHHGPIIPTIGSNHVIEPLDPSKGAVSMRWTGLEATTEIAAVFDLLKAKDVDEARTALNKFGVGAQNWMIGDTSGNILWTSHANVPIRDTRAYQWDASKYTGTLPCLILPGDGTAEWKGYLPDDTVPWVKNPAAGFISTANNDPIGVSLDNDPSNDKLPDGTPQYLACQFDIGFREGRIQTRIKAHTDPFKTDDLADIQADMRSAMGSALAPALITALDRAEEERASPGTHPDLTAIVKDAAYDGTKIKTIRALLADWGQTSDYAAPSGIDPETNKPLAATGADAAAVSASQATLIFNAWLVRVTSRIFGDELARMKLSFQPGAEPMSKALLHLFNADPQTLATYDAATGDSSLWDDIDTAGVVESRNERMVRGLLDALTDLGMMAGPDISTYRWGTFHTIRFAALVPVFGTLSIPPTADPTFPNGFPRKGDSFTVDAAQYTFVDQSTPLDFTYGAGPAQRFVIEMDPSGPKAFNALPGGAVWDATSPHFRDEAEYWRKNQNHPVPFALADVIAAKEKRTVVYTK